MCRRIDKFIGFDAYRKAMDCLKPGDVVIFATPPGVPLGAFHVRDQKGLNVFMEKPSRWMGRRRASCSQLAEESEKKNMKVGVGLMIRHCKARQELHRRIEGWRDWRDHVAARLPDGGPGRTRGPVPSGQTEVGYQIRRFHSFLWASGGIFSDFNIHQIDECCWMKGAGRSARMPPAADIIAAIRWTKTSIIIPWNTPIPTGPNFSLSAEPKRGVTMSSPVMRTAPKAQPSFPPPHIHPANAEFSKAKTLPELI